jgi:hypothetical protein
MARRLESDEAQSVAYRGEVWTDSRGRAIVKLPPGANPPRPPLEYVLRVLDGQIHVQVAAELNNGRFTIESDQPHIKVAWRISGRRWVGQRGQVQQPSSEEEVQP